MKHTLTLTIKVEVEAAGHEMIQADADVLYETEKALDYWFGHTDRQMSAKKISLADS